MRRRKVHDLELPEFLRDDEFDDTVPAMHIALFLIAMAACAGLASLT